MPHARHRDLAAASHARPHHLGARAREHEAIRDPQRLQRMPQGQVGRVVGEAAGFVVSGRPTRPDRRGCRRLHARGEAGSQSRRAAGEDRRATTRGHPSSGPMRSDISETSSSLRRHARFSREPARPTLLCVPSRRLSLAERGRDPDVRTAMETALGDARRTVRMAAAVGLLNAGLGLSLARRVHRCASGGDEGAREPGPIPERRSRGAARTGQDVLPRRPVEGAPKHRCATP